MKGDGTPYQVERRLLAKLSGGRQLSGNPGGGVRKGITAMDVSAALAGLTRRTKADMRVPDHLARSLLLYTWADDITQKPVATRYLVLHMSTWAAQEKWRIRPGWLHAMSETALTEHTNRKICVECAATGRIWTAGEYRYLQVPSQGGGVRLLRQWEPGATTPCPQCAGRGVFPWSLRQRTQIVGAVHGDGLHWNTWRECWDDRYCRLLALISRTELRALRRLRGKIGR